jgi:hypothetical protein
MLTHFWIEGAETRTEKDWKMFEYSSDPEIRAIIRRAHQERAEMTAAMLKSVFRAFRLGRLRTANA